MILSEAKLIINDGGKLAERLQSARRVQTAAMKRGIECEVVAANAYCKVNVLK